MRVTHRVMAGRIVPAAAVVGALLAGAPASAQPASDGVPEPTVVGPAEGDGYRWFGSAIDVDGDTMVVGAFGDHTASPPDSTARDGSAYVFVRTDAGWVQQAKIVPDDIARDDYFGIDVAVSGDTIVIGAQYDDFEGGLSSGSAYVYGRTGDTWTQQAKLMHPDPGPSDLFGAHVDIDGDTVVVGAPLDDDDCRGCAETVGSAWVFVRTGSHWELQDRLKARDREDGDQFGTDVAIRADTIVAGAYRGNSDTAVDSGAAYVFHRSGTNWKPRAKLTGHNAVEGDVFGSAVDLDGDTAVVGAPYHEPQGLVYVFVKAQRTWTQQAVLRNPDPEGSLGWRVGITGDTVASGGGAIVFTRTDGTWNAGIDLEPADFSEDQFSGGGLAIDDGVLAVSRRTLQDGLVLREEVLIYEQP